MQHVEQRPYAWSLALIWLLVGDLVAGGLLFESLGAALMLLTLAAVFGTWLVWHTGLRRENWAVLFGATAWPLAVLWQHRYVMSCSFGEPGEAVLCPAVAFSWEPWVALTLALPAVGIVASVRPSVQPTNWLRWSNLL